METNYTITKEPNNGERSITLLLNGKFGEDALPELDQSISEARNAQQRIYLDLSEVTLVDRRTVDYISEQASHDIRLVNCPIYLQRWIRQVNDEVEN
ncbi:MAG: hypothetical protein JO097_08455 [Acidobacteriaceae bacterium]|nr:hypothetical protein [Acidobacteriaceae bacterium]MBV9296164.1 hypothetical protein [Acidobacteriaceae bacterium]MBV9766747.1 hypothetical protein [Acidobacteriaceae bacterium]